jgi:protein-tyrosine phosphatase
MNNAVLPKGSLWQLHSKREKLACITDFARWKLGLLNKYVNVDYSRVDRVIFVCKGNICRSAYAEKKFNMLAGGAISAGVDAKSGRPANADAVRLAAERGVDLSPHRTQNLSDLQVRSGDLFVCMEKWHAEAVEAYFGVRDKQVLLLGGLLGLPRVSDPYNKCDRYFILVFEEINAAIDLLRAKLPKPVAQ